MSQNPEFEVALGSRALRASSETSVSFRDNAQAYEAGYAKALDDYAVVDLLRKLSDFDAIDEGGRSIAPSWEEAFRGRQAPPKPEVKRDLPGKPLRQIPSLLTRTWMGVGTPDEGVPNVW
jgi:hypothetical protein